MNIDGLFESIDLYIGYLDSATDPVVIMGLVQSLNILLAFMLHFVEWGM
jgi:hypothetical protein